jgi:hypothetical protein
MECSSENQKSLVKYKELVTKGKCDDVADEVLRLSKINEAAAKWEACHAGYDIHSSL